MLFDDEGVQYLSVVCGSVGLYNVDICLTPEESASVTCDGTGVVAALARTVMLKPSAFQARHVDGFSKRLGVSEAIAAWRVAK